MKSSKRAAGGFDPETEATLFMQAQGGCFCFEIPKGCLLANVALIRSVWH